jgi:GDP-L-fucose synthase
MKIVVTGGSGMVGRSLQKILPNARYLSSKDFDLSIREGVEALYIYEKPDVLIHLAAKVGGIVDNIKRPAEYFDDNILMNTLLVKYARIYGLKRFIGILSTCIYPDVVETYPLKEEQLHLGPPTATNFSYGYAKRSLAVQIEAYNKQYETKYQYLIPCNLYGEFDKFGENSHFVSALIKKIHYAKINNEKSIMLFGTGTPLRQFMHSDDLAKVIKSCIDLNVYDSFNVATEENLTIHEIAKIALEAMDAKHINITYDPSKPNGQHRKDVSIEKLKQAIPDFDTISLYEGIKQTYKILLETNTL